MSKKRMLLIRNLKHLINRIEEGITPIRIIEVWVFGSFLRMKANPRDVDLIIFYKKDPVLDEQVEMFRQFILMLNKTEEGCEKLEELSSNQALARAFAKKRFPSLPVDVWLKHIKVSGSMRAYLRYYFHPIDITRKVLKQGIRYIQIAQISDINEKDEIFSRMSAQNFKLVWSADERDVDKNLGQSIQEQITATIAEMKNFLIQTERYKSYYYVLINVLKKAIGFIESFQLIPNVKQLIEYARELGKERGIFETYLNWIINQIKYSESVEEPDLKQPVTNLDIDQKIKEIQNSISNFSKLGEICELMRKEINTFRSKCLVARFLLHQIIYPSEECATPPIEERVPVACLRTFMWIPMYQAKDEIKREVLSDLGLHEINRHIVLVESLGRKSEYRLADSDDQIQEWSKLSKIGRTEKEYAKYIRPILRKIFPRKVHTSVTFTTTVRESGVVVPEQVQLNAVFRGQEMNNFLEMAKNLGFKVIHSSVDYCWVSLNIDISHLDGDRKEIKKLIKNKLGLSSKRSE